MHGIDKRYKAVVHYLHFCRSLRKVANLYNVSKSSLHRWVAKKNPFSVRKVRARKALLADARETIQSTLNERPFATAKDVAFALNQCGLKVSMSTASRWVHSAGFTWKKAFKAVAIQHDTAKVMKFCNEYMACKPDQLVCIDEMAFYVGDRPRRGYAPRGKRLNVPSTRGLRHRKYTVLMAVSRAGVIHYQVSDKNCNKASFKAFIDSLPCPVGTSLLMDNVAFHKRTIILQQNYRLDDNFYSSYVKDGMQ